MTGVAWSGEPPRTRRVPCRGPRKVHTNTASPLRAPPPSPRVCGGALSAGVVGTIHSKGLREDQEESEAERACQPRKFTQGFQGAGTSSRPNWGHKGASKCPRGKGGCGRGACGHPEGTPWPASTHGEHPVRAPQAHGPSPEPVPPSHPGPSSSLPCLPLPYT